MIRLVALLLALVACTSRNPDAIVLWHAYNGTEREALEASAARWNAAHPDRPLELVGVPHAAFADKLTNAIPNGNGPDLFIYAQDRIGGWVDAGVVEPIEFWLDDAKLDRFSTDSIRAMDYKGSLWGLPMTVKSLALFYRTDLVPTPPATTDELFALGHKIRARNKDGYALAYANIDLYGHAPWLFGHGGTLLDERGELAIANPQSAHAMEFARKLVADKIAPGRAEAPLVASLFNEGMTATAISGPWFITGIDKSVPWAVAELPIVSSTGKRATPFLGVEGVLMSSRARDKDTAFLVMDWLTSDASAIERAQIARQVVPNGAADPTIAKDPVLAAFRAQLAHAAPMSLAPAMRMVWTPYKAALGEVVSGRAEAGAQLLAVEREVQNYVDGITRD